ncbi:DNA/RNA non-specific endonuclease [Polyangium aurulentum]|uniref:DNA/RNA non-specific endonuclease n=1 Tax=Polyangium aurulentum TaxID=2567896 RepID=UPI001F2900DC|nr:DNA/RNA non-specific endonuclease [Polyangium aurulentum]
MAFIVALLGSGAATLYACRGERLLEDLASSGGAEGGKGKASPRATTSGAPATPGKGSGAAKPPKKSGAATVHLELGTPEDGDASDDRMLVRSQYALSYNPTRNVANWVSWQLEAKWFGDVPRFKGKFMEDPELPAGLYRVKHDDYTGSGFDRGHMVRSEERTRTAEDNKATFFTTNILPQTHDLNAGPWLRLEEHCEERARRQGRQLFVMAGGVLARGKKSMKTIGHDVAVPDTYWKIVIELDPGQGAGNVGADTPVIAVLMPNDTGIIGEGWEKYRTSVDEIEKRTGYDFLTAVDKGVQEQIEARRE